jgi:hypothetical protein
MEERRLKERCIYCNGEECGWKEDGVIKKYCIICGKEFVARREADKHKFIEIAKEYNS